MRPLRPANKVFIPLFVVAVALITTWISQKNAATTADDPPSPTARPALPAEPPVTDDAPPPNKGPGAPFDFYLLALTLHPAFCADGHAREPECRTEPRIPISIHGLWPENLAPGKYPRDCPGPPLDLSASTERRLATLMPGMADGLHVHEWRKHGTCSGIDDDVYFNTTYLFAQQVAAALGDELTTRAGGSASAAELRRHADARRPGLGDSLTFHCRTLRAAPPEHRREPYLIEIRQCIDDDGRDGAPGSTISCATVNRRDQGCGRSFRIAGR